MTRDCTGHKALTRDEFIADYCARSGITREQFLEYGDAAPCDCGEGTCAGWRYKTQPDPDTCDHPDCKGPLVCAEPGCEVLHPNACSADESTAGWRCHRHGLFCIDPESIVASGILIAMHGRTIVHFQPDGTIELGDGYTPSEAGDAFIEALRHTLPSQADNDKLAEKCEQLEAEVERFKKERDEAVQAAVDAIEDERTLSEAVAAAFPYAESSVLEPYGPDLFARVALAARELKRLRAEMKR